MKTLNYITAFALSLLTITACNQASTEEKKEEPSANKPTDEVTLSKDQHRVAALQIGKLEMRSLSDVIKANGAIDVPPENMVSISAPLGGYIKSSGLLPGQQIRKGQVIATIENPVFIDIQQEYLESKSRFEFLALEYKRQEQLRKEDVNSAKTFQQVSSEYKMIQARMSGLEQKLSLIGIHAKNLQSGKISKTSNLYSPINGYITASNATTGKYVNPTDVIFELANKSEMHLALNVYERDAAKIKVGQSIKFALANETAYNRNAKVFLIGKSTGAGGTVPVHCHLQGAGNTALFPGMYAKAMIETTNQTVPALPNESIVQSDGMDYIFIQASSSESKGFTFKMIPVKKGIEQEGYTEVILPEAFDKNATIVLKGGLHFAFGNEKCGRIKYGVTNNGKSLLSFEYEPFKNILFRAISLGNCTDSYRRNSKFAVLCWGYSFARFIGSNVSPESIMDTDTMTALKFHRSSPVVQ